MVKPPFVLMATWLLLAAGTAMADCPPEGTSRQDLLALRQAGFDVAAPERDALAVRLLDCLGDADPAIRDGVVYEGLAAWLRGELLQPATVDILYLHLLEDLEDGADADGFLQPFAALVLSEVARTDRVGDTFTPDRREALVTAAATYLQGIDDYRGFSETEGWRHNVAHGADLALQLVLNEHIDAAQVERLVTPLLTQVSPPGETFYVYGEPNRLARAVFYAHSRGVVPAERWEGWLQALADPAPLGSWSEAYTSQAGLARRHNTLAFLSALHVYTTAAHSEQGQALDALVMQAIEQAW